MSIINISHPHHGSKICTEPGCFIMLYGIWDEIPNDQEHIHALVRRDNFYWPQYPLEGVNDRHWETRLDIGTLGHHEVMVCRLSRLARDMFAYYRKVIGLHRNWRDQLQASLGQEVAFPTPDWVAFEMESLPHGIEVLDRVSFEVEELRPLVP